MVVALDVGQEILDALSFAGGMTWEILWALILGFALSALVQAVVSKEEMRRLLPDDSPGTVAKATALGAASSSCSYAAVALARSLFRKGADFTSAMAFQFASTNLVFELGIVMGLLLGWEFVAGEFVGGPLMIVLMVVAFRLFLTPRLVAEARAQAEKGRLGSMEGHAEMDMSVHGRGSWWQRLRTPAGFTATSDYFVMDWAAIGRDIVAGLLIAGALAAWVPDSFWQGLFLTDHPTAAKLWGPLIGPLVALLFEALGIVPTDRSAVVTEASVTWNYTTYLNIVFLAVAGVLLWRYFTRGGGWKMLKMMDEPMDHGHHHGEAHGQA